MTLHYTHQRSLLPEKRKETHTIGGRGGVTTITPKKAYFNQITPRNAQIMDQPIQKRGLYNTKTSPKHGETNTQKCSPQQKRTGKTKQKRIKFYIKRDISEKRIMMSRNEPVFLKITRNRLFS